MTTEITICLTTYNRTKELKQALQSILNQSYENFKVIIGNDFVEKRITFESLELEFDERVKIINHKENLGEIENGNFIVNLCETEWFCYLSDDDLIHPNFLEELILIKEKENNISAIFPNFTIGKTVTNSFFLNTKNKYEKFFNQKEFLRHYLTNKIPLIGCYGLIKTDILKMIGGLPKLSKDQNIYSDFILPIFLSRYGTIGWTNQKLVFNRAHEDSRSMNTTFNNLIESQDNCYEIISSEMNENRFAERDINSCNYQIMIQFAAAQMYILSKDINISLINLIKIFISRQFLISAPKVSINLKFIFIFKVKILLLKGIIRRFKILAFSR